MTNVLDKFWIDLCLEDYEDNCEIMVETDIMKILKVEYDLLKEHSGRWLHFIAVEYPELKKSLSPQKLMEIEKKAEKWDKIKKAFPSDRLRMMLEILEEQTSGDTPT